MALRYSKTEALQGMLIYASGDLVATFVLNCFSWQRLLGMMVIGATVYALEIPNYFRWIDRKTAHVQKGWRFIAAKTALALLYFNPLWIARHLFFIAILQSGWAGVSVGLLWAGLISWAINIPISLVGNLVIQGYMPLKWRFVASATFSGMMAVYYAMCGVWFNG